MSAVRDLSRWALVSIATALVVIALKLIAWRVTGSVGLASDAAESVVNLVAATVAFIALRIAARSPDAGHNFGHLKVEYISAIVEGVMIAAAATVIVASAVDRLLHPRELEHIGIGLGISVLASLINATVAMTLLRVGRRHRSLALEADGKHLMTDVWTTAGVVVGVGLVQLTGWLPLDPLIAIAVAVNILVVGAKLVRRSTAGLMDSALPGRELARIEAALVPFCTDGVRIHDLRTRASGRLRFVQLHLLVPGDWSVQRGHDLTEQVEDALHDAVEDAVPVVHLEPVDDPRSYETWRMAGPC